MNPINKIEYQDSRLSIAKCGLNGLITISTLGLESELSEIQVLNVRPYEVDLIREFRGESPAESCAYIEIRKRFTLNRFTIGSIEDLKRVNSQLTALGANQLSTRIVGRLTTFDIGDQ